MPSVNWTGHTGLSLCDGCTHNAIACNLEVLLGERSLVEVTVKVPGGSEGSGNHHNTHSIWIGVTLRCPTSFESVDIISNIFISLLTPCAPVE